MGKVVVAGFLGFLLGALAFVFILTWMVIGSIYYGAAALSTMEVSPDWLLVVSLGVAVLVLAIASGWFNRVTD